MLALAMVPHSLVLHLSGALLLSEELVLTRHQELVVVGRFRCRAVDWPWWACNAEHVLLGPQITESETGPMVWIPVADFAKAVVIS
jgi:hypothetical protein